MLTAAIGIAGASGILCIAAMCSCIIDCYTLRN